MDRRNFALLAAAIAVGAIAGAAVDRQVRMSRETVAYRAGVAIPSISATEIASDAPPTLPAPSAVAIEPTRLEPASSAAPTAVSSRSIGFPTISSAQDQPPVGAAPPVQDTVLPTGDSWGPIGQDGERMVCNGAGNCVLGSLYRRAVTEQQQFNGRSDPGQNALLAETEKMAATGHR